MALNPLIQRFLDDTNQSTASGPSKRVPTQPIDRFLQWKPTQTAVGTGVGRPTSSGLGGQLAAPSSKDALKQRVFNIAQKEFGWGGSELTALDRLIQAESSWNPNADNPTSTAAGLFQKLQSVHGPLEKNLDDQIRWGLNYIASRPDYGTPSRAWYLWNTRDPHWY
jgi:hypothetical protein